MIVYLVDVGVLIHEGEHEFESYNCVYNHKYGFYDENQWYVRSKQEAIKAAKEYVDSGVENTYAIVSQEETNKDEYDDDDYNPSDHEYTMDNVVYSSAKINGSIVEHFLGE